MRVLVVILVAALLAVVAISGLRASGEADQIFVSSGSAEVGGDVTVTLGVAEMTDPPHGAWTIDVTYDSDVITPTECLPIGNSVCSPSFNDDTIRSTGASAAGIFAHTDFAHITFLCEEAGVSPLALSLSVWGDATGFNQEKVEIEEGTITCEEHVDRLVVGSTGLEPGGEDVIQVMVEAPGLASWRFDVLYDTSVVIFLDCIGAEEVGGTGNPSCGLERPGRVRILGVSAEGLGPEAVLAELWFRCDSRLETELTVVIDVWARSGVAIPEAQLPPPEVEEGLVACTLSGPEPPPQLPNTGVAEPQPGTARATVPLAVLGAVLLAAAFAFRRYALR